jgi:hypothetical protein
MRRATSILALVFLLLAGVVLAADGYDVSWHVISGGGGHSAGGAYTLDGSVLQKVGEMSGGDYELQSGFWYGVSVAPAVIDWAYLPVIVKSFSLP